MEKILFLVPTADDNISLCNLIKFNKDMEFSIFNRRIKNDKPLLKFFIDCKKYVDNIEPDYIICMHDDLWLIDNNFSNKVKEAFEMFDYWGVAGTNMMLTSNPRWHIPIGSAKYLSGLMEHKSPDGLRFMTSFGPYPVPCSILDGVFMAFKREVFEKLVDVPELNGFHMYDMEMCTQVWDMGYKGGVQGIHLYHESRGEGIRTGEWERLAKVYSKRWERYKIIGGKK